MGKCHSSFMDCKEKHRRLLTADAYYSTENASIPHKFEKIL